MSLVSSIPTDPYNISAYSFMEFPDILGERFERDIPFRTRCCKVSHYL